MRMAVVGARATPAAAPAPHCHPHDDVFPTMAYRLPCNGGSASTYYGASTATPFPPAAAFGAAPGQVQLDVFECLSDESLPAAVPGTFGAPPPMPVVPDAAGCSHARIAFRTRSEDKVLDDGYKWRKYGKKSVKNSPNPRNYYRCSTEGCNVKKRVERERDDPSYVLTMYEGVHNHVSPGTIYYATQDAASGRFFLAGMHHSGY